MPANHWFQGQTGTQASVLRCLGAAPLGSSQLAAAPSAFISSFCLTHDRSGMVITQLGRGVRRHFAGFTAANFRLGLQVLFQLAGLLYSGMCPRLTRRLAPASVTLGHRRRGGGSMAGAHSHTLHPFPAGQHCLCDMGAVTRITGIPL